MSRYGNYINPDGCYKYGIRKSWTQTWWQKLLGRNKYYCPDCLYNGKCYANDPELRKGMITVIATKK